MGSAQAAEKLKFAHIYETTEPYHAQALWAADEIKKRTDGRYEIEVFPASSLGKEVRVFDSTAILLYLAEKSRKFLGSQEDRPELLSWLLFIASGLGPFSGQAVHFQFAAPEGLDYAVNRYRREAERHYQVLNDHLAGRTFIVGDTYTIADISAWGWLDRASRVLKGRDVPLAAFPNLKRFFETVDARPAVARARAVSQNHQFKTVVDEETKRALFPSNYVTAA